MSYANHYTSTGVIFGLPCADLTAWLFFQWRGVEEKLCARRSLIGPRTARATRLLKLLSTANTTLRPGPLPGGTPLRDAMLKGFKAAMKALQASMMTMLFFLSFPFFAPVCRVVSVSTLRAGESVELYL